jgi:hypothetical protein
MGTRSCILITVDGASSQAPVCEKAGCFRPFSFFRGLSRSSLLAEPAGFSKRRSNRHQLRSGMQGSAFNPKTDLRSREKAQKAQKEWLGAIQEGRIQARQNGSLSPALEPFAPLCGQSTLESGFNSCRPAFSSWTWRVTREMGHCGSNALPFRKSGQGNFSLCNLSVCATVWRNSEQQEKIEPL